MGRFGIFTSSFSESWYTPGIDGTPTRPSTFSETNNGRMKSSRFSTVSRVSARNSGVARKTAGAAQQIHCARLHRLWLSRQGLTDSHATPTKKSSMRYEPLDPKLFTENRARLAKLLPAKAIAVVNANDILSTNADGTLALRQNSDLFYLTGVEQEETILLLFPGADDEKMREILFLREPHDETERWEGHKLRRGRGAEAHGHQAVQMDARVLGHLPPPGL
jgi:hypothetical protein